MRHTRRAITVLATTVVAGTLMSSDASAQMQTVHIIGTKNANYTSGYTGGFDNYMTTFYGSATMSDTGFSIPESEAWQYAYAAWSFFGGTPSAHVELNACSPDYRVTDASRSTTSHDDAMLRKLGATQMLTGVFPNFINVKKDGLLVKVSFSDGGSEVYRHTTMYGWQVVNNTLQLGSGVPMSAC